MLIKKASFRDRFLNAKPASEDLQERMELFMSKMAVPSSPPDWNDFARTIKWVIPTLPSTTTRPSTTTSPKGFFNQLMDSLSAKDID